MIGIEETIWAASLVQETPSVIVKGRPLEVALIAACWQVNIFRAGKIVSEPSLDEALAMCREVRGTVEHEKLRIQKELLGGVIQRLEERVEQIRRRASGDFERLQDRPISQELQSLVEEFRKTLG